MKQLLVICIILSLALCTACNTSNRNEGYTESEGYTQLDDYENEAADTEDNEEVYNDSEEVEYDVDSDSEDELEQIRTEIVNDGGIYLLHNGNAYSLSDHVYEVDGIDYYSTQHFAGTDALDIYEPPFEYQDYYMYRSIGNVPAPVIQPDDTVVIHSETEVPTLTLKTVNFYGKSICLTHNLAHDAEFFNYEVEESIHYYDPDTRKPVHFSGVSNVEIKDSDGELVEDFCNLNDGEYYTVSWYQGTEYEEVTLKADCNAYVYESGVDQSTSTEPDYEVEPELTEEGAIYDLSEIPPGLYVTGTEPHTKSGGVIEIP